MLINYMVSTPEVEGLCRYISVIKPFDLAGVETVMRPLNPDQYGELIKTCLVSNLGEGNANLLDTAIYALDGRPYSLRCVMNKFCCLAALARHGEDTVRPYAKELLRHNSEEVRKAYLIHLWAQIPPEDTADYQTAFFRSFRRGQHSSETFHQYENRNHDMKMLWYVGDEWETLQDVKQMDPPITASYQCTIRHSDLLCPP